MRQFVLYSLSFGLVLFCLLYGDLCDMGGLYTEDGRI